MPELRQLREQIAAGELGQISLLSCMQWDSELPSEQFRSHSGGIMVDMGVHEFDQVRWLLGDEFESIVAVPAGPSTQPRPATDPDSAVLLATTSGGAAVTISLGRQFPHPDSCWVEVWGTRGYARIPFMWDTEGDDVFRVSMRRQAEAFARAVGGGVCEGAQAHDAIAAQLVAARAAEALGGGTADAPHASSAAPADDLIDLIRVDRIRSLPCSGLGREAPGVGEPSETAMKLRSQPPRRAVSKPIDHSTRAEPRDCIAFVQSCGNAEARAVTTAADRQPDGDSVGPSRRAGVGCGQPRGVTREPRDAA